eukprot:6181178-Pleurochrysis_carterae.AAC.4
MSSCSTARSSVSRTTASSGTRSCDASSSAARAIESSDDRPSSKSAHARVSTSAAVLKCSPWLNLAATSLADLRRRWNLRAISCTCDSANVEPAHGPRCCAGCSAARASWSVQASLTTSPTPWPSDVSFALISPLADSASPLQSLRKLRTLASAEARASRSRASELAQCSAPWSQSACDASTWPSSNSDSTASVLSLFRSPTKSSGGRSPSLRASAPLLAARQLLSLAPKVPD